MRQTRDGHFVLDDREIDQAMRVSDALKVKFALVIQAAMAAARDDGIAPDCVMSAVVTEALLVAACCHGGTEASFRVMVDLALAAARRVRADLETVQ